MSKENLLYHYCRWDDKEKVSEVLFEDPSAMVNVIYDDGVLLKIALSSETTDLLKVLLDYYYDQHGLREKPETYNIEQKQAKHKLFEILQDAVISEEMQKTLEDYGIYQNYDNSSTYSQEEIEKSFEFQQHSNHDLSIDLSDNHLKNLSVDLIDTPPIRKSYSTGDMKNHSWQKSDSTHEHSNEELFTVEKLKDCDLIKLKNDLRFESQLNQTYYECDALGKNLDDTTYND